MKTKHGCLIVEVLVLALTGVFLFLALNSTHPESSIIRDYIIAHGSEHTGALNLVTAIYLGYRAFDTLGETIVLLLAVSGVVYFTDSNGKDKAHEQDNNT
jgi:multicomponent Na+:H+ antiporter subunit B